MSHPADDDLSPTRWPATTVDPERLRTTWSRLVSSTQTFQAALVAAFDDAGVTLPEVAALAALCRRGNRRLTLSELAVAVGLTPGGLTRCVDRMEVHGWVVRESAPGDRRVVLAVLTPEGEAASARFDRLHREYLVEHLGDRLGDDGLAAMAQLCALLGDPVAVDASS